MFSDLRRCLCYIVLTGSPNRWWTSSDSQKKKHSNLTFLSPEVRNSPLRRTFRYLDGQISSFPVWLPSVDGWQQWCDLWAHSSGEKESVLRQPAGWNGMCRHGNDVSRPARISFSFSLNYKHKDSNLFANLFVSDFLSISFICGSKFFQVSSLGLKGWLKSVCVCVSCLGCIPVSCPVAAGIESSRELPEQTSDWKQLDVIVGTLRRISTYTVHIRTTRGR